MGSVDGRHTVDLSMSQIDFYRHLPPGRAVHLPGRGDTYIRELPGPPGAPTIVLLHGWTATGALNWATSMEELAEHFHVVAIDHRGHGRGLKSKAKFSIEACADDVDALMQQLDIPNAVVAGYSMGGPIAQQLALRHPDRVAGLVMCATAARFPHSAPAAIPLDMVSQATRVNQAVARRDVLPFARHGLYKWVPVADESGRHDPRVQVECGSALSRYNALSRLRAINIPSASVITTRDQLVPPRLQHELARALNAHIVEVNSFAGHFVAARTRSWTPKLVSAALDVAARAPNLARGSRGISGEGLGGVA